MKIKNSILFLLLCVFACNDSRHPPAGPAGNIAQQEPAVYTCPMHPEIVRNVPGQCPICGMDLVKKISGGKKESNKQLQLLLKPTNVYVISQVNTVKPEEKELPAEITATGYISYDTEQINTVSARVSGRIEKLYVKYRYQPVIKGQKLMDIYSKELETEQQNYLFLLKNDPENRSLINSSEQKLLLLGLNRENVNKLTVSGNMLYTVSIYSPYSGHLHDVIASDNAAGMTNESMNSSVPSMPGLQLKEGMYVSKGQTVFAVYDTRKLWALLSIYPGDQGLVKTGQKIMLEIEGVKNKEIHAFVSFIEPVIRDNQKTITARVSLDNPSGEIKTGARVKAKVNEKKQKRLFVPSSSIVNLGLNQVVFVKQEELFTGKQVKSGIQSGKWTEIISGITIQDILAENGQMLMDSESFIKIENE